MLSKNGARPAFGLRVRPLHAIRELLFLRNHRKACAAQLASEAARSLARAGAEKRRRPIKSVARQIRRELGLPADRRLV